MTVVFPSTCVAFIHQLAPARLFYLRKFRTDENHHLPTVSKYLMSKTFVLIFLTMAHMATIWSDSVSTILLTSIPVETSEVSTKSYEEHVTVASVLRGSPNTHTDIELSRPTESSSTRALPAAGTEAIKWSSLANAFGVGTIAPNQSRTADMRPTAVISPSLAASPSSTDRTSVIIHRVAGIPTSSGAHTTQQSFGSSLDSLSSLPSLTAGSQTLGKVAASAVESRSGNFHGMSVASVFQSTFVLAVLTESAIAKSSATAYSVISYGFSSLTPSISSSVVFGGSLDVGVTSRTTPIAVASEVASVSPSPKLYLSTEVQQISSFLLASLRPSVTVSKYSVPSSDSRGLHPWSVLGHIDSLPSSSNPITQQESNLSPSGPFSFSAASSQTIRPSRTLSIPLQTSNLSPFGKPSSATSSQTLTVSKPLKLSTSEQFTASETSSQALKPSQAPSSSQTDTLLLSEKLDPSTQTLRPSTTLSIPQTGSLLLFRPLSSSGTSSHRRIRSQSVLSATQLSLYSSVASDSVVVLRWIPSTVLHTTTIIPSFQQSCQSGSSCSTFASSMPQSSSVRSHSFTDDTSSFSESVDLHSSEAISKSLSYNTLPQGEITQISRPSATAVLSGISSALPSTASSPSHSDTHQINESSEITHLRSSTFHSSSTAWIVTSKSLTNEITAVSGAVLSPSMSVTSPSLTSKHLSTSLVTVATALSRSATELEVMPSTNLARSGITSKSKIDSYSSVTPVSLTALSSLTEMVGSTGYPSSPAFPTDPISRQAWSAYTASAFSLFSHRQSTEILTDSLVPVADSTNFMGITVSSVSASIPSIAVVFPTSQSSNSTTTTPLSPSLTHVTTKRPLVKSSTAHTVTSLSDYSFSPNFTRASTVDKVTPSSTVQLSLDLAISSTGLFASSLMDIELSTPLTTTKAAAIPSYSSRVVKSTELSSPSISETSFTVRTTGLTGSSSLVLTSGSLLPSTSSPKHIATQIPNISTVRTSKSSTSSTTMQPTWSSRYFSETVASVSVPLILLYQSTVDIGLKTAIPAPTNQYLTNLPQINLRTHNSNRMSSVATSSAALVETSSALLSLQSVSKHSTDKFRMLSSSILPVSSPVTRGPSAPPTSGGPVPAGSSSTAVIAGGIAGGLFFVVVIVVVVVLLRRRRSSRSRYGSGAGNKVKETVRRWREPESMVRSLETHQKAIESLKNRLVGSKLISRNGEGKRRDGPEEITLNNLMFKNVNCDC